MPGDHVETRESDSGLAFSIYEAGDYSVWIKVGAGALEVPIETLPDLHEMIEIIMERLLELGGY